MKSAIHTYFIQNGLPVDRKYFIPEMAECPVSVYEVIRLIDGVPLFLEAHYRRLKKSTQLVGYELAWELRELADHIRQLVELNRVTMGNIKVLFQCREGERGDLYTCFIPYEYPTESTLREGVSAGLLLAERANPNAKVDNSQVRRRADEMIREKELYEVILVDHDGFLTEGSRSNIFGIRQGEVITPPSDAVLPGITREKLIDIGYQLGNPVQQQPIHKRDLPSLDAFFITGTSPGVLPVAQLEDYSFDVEDDTLGAFRRAYEQLVRTYVRLHNSVMV